MRAVLVVVLAASVAAAGAQAEAEARGGDGQPGVTRYFLSYCGFSHRLRDDPIVFARQPGVSHDHTFVGNVSSNAYSQLSSLRAAGTTCEPTADRSAYWAPTLVLGTATPVRPVGAVVYYRRLTAAPVRPFPPGLRMIAGSASAHGPQSSRVTSWECGVIKTRFYTSARRRTIDAAERVPSCRSTANLQLRVNFPNCWDGKRLDSVDHAGHMAYSMRRRCPLTHPVPVPAISLVYRYAVRDGAAVSLSSGPAYTAHADFVNAWSPAALSKLVESCLNAGRDCGAVS